MKKERFKKFLAWLLLIAMLIGEIPYGVFARGNDTDLKKFLESVSLTDNNGNKIPEENGKLKFKKGDTYKLSMTFTETADHQFPNDQELTYTIPKGLEMIGGGTKNFEIRVTYSGAGGAPQTVTVTDNTYEIKDGVLTVKFNAGDPNYDKLKGSADVTFTINNDFKVTEEITEIAFSDEIKKDTFVVDEKPDGPKPPDPPTPPEEKKPSFRIAIWSKYGREENKEGKVRFYIQVRTDTNTDIKNLKITDKQIGEILNIDEDSVRIKELYGSELSKDLIKIEKNGTRNTGFTITIPEIKKGQTADFNIEFTATVDYEKIHGESSTEAQTLNKVTVSCDNGENTPEATTFQQIPYFDFEMISPKDEEQDKSPSKLIWRPYGDGTTCPNYWPVKHVRIKVNEFFHRDMGNARIHEILDVARGLSAFGFKGEGLPIKEGLKIVGRDRDGNIIKDYQVPLKNIKIQKSQYSYERYDWSYTFPEDAGNLYYEIDYEYYPINLNWYRSPTIDSDPYGKVDRKNPDKSVDGGQYGHISVTFKNEKAGENLDLVINKPTMDWEKWQLNWDAIITVPSCIEATGSRLGFYSKTNLIYLKDGSTLDRIDPSSYKVYEEVKNGNKSEWKELSSDKEKIVVINEKEIEFQHFNEEGKWTGGLLPKPGDHRYKITFTTGFNDYLGYYFPDSNFYEDHGMGGRFHHGIIIKDYDYDEKDKKKENYFRYYPERLIIASDQRGYDSSRMANCTLYIQNFPTDEPRDIEISVDKTLFELAKNQDGKIKMELMGRRNGSPSGTTEVVNLDVTESEKGYVAHIENWPKTWRNIPKDSGDPQYYELYFTYNIKKDPNKDPNDPNPYLDEFYKRALEDPEGKVYLKSSASTPSAKWLLNPKESKNEIIYSNETTQDKTYKAQTKTVSTQKDENNNTIANYRLIVNQSGTDYLPEDDFLILEDTMSSNMSLVYGTLKFHNLKTGKDDNLKWTYDSAKKVLKANIPDGVPYEVTYTCLITGTGRQTLSNTATISGQGKVTNTTTETVSSDTTGSASIPFITIQKVDKDAYQIPLKGAEFKLYEKVGNDWKAVQKNNVDVKTYTTDETGKAIITADQNKDGWALQYNKEYAVKEVTPPEGYYINKDYHPFILVKEPTAVENNYTLGQIKIIEDEMITCPYELKATKILKDTNGKAAKLSEGSFSFQLDIAKTDDANINLSALKFEPLEVLKNKADGSIASSLKLRGVGTHVLKLREIIPEKIEAGDKYDKSIYYLVVKVVKDTSLTEGLKVESAKMYKGDLTTSVEKIEFTNTIGKIRSIEVEKTWENLPENVDKPEVTIKLLKDGVETDQVLKLNKESWKGTFSNLPRFKDDGTEIVYKVKEVGDNNTLVENGPIKIGGKDYTVATSGDATKGFTIINTAPIEKITVKATKEWKAETGVAAPTTNPTIKLALHNGETQVGDPVELTNGKTAAEWKDVPKTDANGNLINYTVKEIGEENKKITLDKKEYTVKVEGNVTDGFKITNTLNKTIPETITVKATKEWAAGDGATLPATKPDVSFDLYADGKIVQGQSKTLTNGITSVTWTDLVKTNANKQDIVYTVKEANVVNNVFTSGEDTYAVTTIGDMTRGFTITNTLQKKETPPPTPQLETLDINVTKKWNPDNADKQEVKVKLIQDGNETDKFITLNEPNWSDSFKDLPKYQTGSTTEIAYTVKEVDDNNSLVENGPIKIGGKDYTVAISGNMANGFTITNTIKKETPPPTPPTPPTPEPEPTPIPKRPEIRFRIIRSEEGLLNKKDHYAYLFGYPDGSFGPRRNMTRAEASAMFARLLLKEYQKVEEYKTIYKDVEEGSWYTKSILIMTRLNILKGYPDGSFKPNASITRAEFAAIASRYEKLEKGEAKFTDIDERHWAYPEVASAYKKGWINGYPDGSFRPENHITREEVVTIANRMLERKCDLDFVKNHRNEIAKYTDNYEDSWSYGDIIEASYGHEYRRKEINLIDEIWTMLNGKKFEI